MEAELHARMGVSKRLLALLALLLALAAIKTMPAQSTGRTVRHHRVAEGPAEFPELAQAEAAIEKKDFATAEPLLQKVVASDPNNYSAWFDLGFVQRGLGKND